MALVASTELIDLAVAHIRQFVVVSVVAQVAFRLSDELRIVHELLLHGCCGARLKMAASDKISKSLAVRRKLLLLIVVCGLEIGCATSTGRHRGPSKVSLHIIGLLLEGVDLGCDGGLAFRLT